MTSFSHVTDWVFDLDNTLYPRHCNLFAQMDVRITDYVMELLDADFDEARKVQKYYFREYGTTLRGLMDEHAIDPHHYLDNVHDIDYSVIPANRELGRLIGALPGRKHIFTNGDVPHAERTLKALQIDGIFDGIFDIAHADFVPKPERAPYDRFLSAHQIDPVCAAMFEDMPRNLETPKELGMATVLVVPPDDKTYGQEGWEKSGSDGLHIDHISDDLNQFISAIVEAMPR